MTATKTFVETGKVQPITMHSMSIVGERTKLVREELGLTQDELAKRAGTKQQSIDHLENGRVDKPRYLNDLARALDVDPAWLEGKTDKRARFPRTTLESALLAIPVRGHVQAGQWREALEWPPDEQYPIWVPPKPGMNPAYLFALEVRGNSMDLGGLPPGSVAVCCHIDGYGKEPEAGKQVVVEQMRDGLVEATVKELVIGADGTRVLMPRSSDPSLNMPVIYHPDAEEVRITGVVIAVWSWR